MYTSYFVQWNGLGGAVHGGGEDFRRGLNREPERGVVGGRDRQSCTSELLFTGDGPGGAVVDVGGESQGLNESGRGTSVVEETEDREGRKS